MFSKADYMESSELRQSQLISPINTETPPRKNEFVKRKQSLFTILDNDNLVSEYYNNAKEIFFIAAEAFSKSNSKGELKLFKSRSFDKNFLIPSIQNYLGSN
jgi:DNA primase